MGSSAQAQLEYAIPKHAAFDYYFELIGSKCRETFSQNSPYLIQLQDRFFKRSLELPQSYTNQRGLALPTKEKTRGQHYTQPNSDPLYSTADVPVKSRGAAGLEWVPGLRGPAGQRSAVSLGHHMALGLLRLSWEIERIWELGLPCLYPDHSTCSMEL